MLAQQLRTLLLIQAGCGALTGWLLASVTGTPLVPDIAVVAVLLPWSTVLLLCLYCAWRASPDRLSRAWWSALLGEWICATRLNLLRQPWVGPSPGILTATGPATASVPGIPVVLVHGNLCNHSIWREMMHHLRAQGHSVLAIDLEPILAPIDQHTAALEQAVQSLRAHTGSRQVALLGHSMGGLVIRAWLRQYGNQHAAVVVTLGTPHCGTQLKQAMPTPNGAQMHWHSAWLHTLASQETQATRALFRIAVSAQDAIVFPQQAQTLEGVQPTVFEGLGHLQLCRSPAVMQWVQSSLAMQ